jgi:hypothetical protein
MHYFLSSHWIPKECYFNNWIQVSLPLCSPHLQLNAHILCSSFSLASFLRCIPSSQRAEYHLALSKTGASWHHLSLQITRKCEKQQGVYVGLGRALKGSYVWKSISWQWAWELGVILEGLDLTKLISMWLHDQIFRFVSLPYLATSSKDRYCHENDNGGETFIFLLLC